MFNKSTDDRISSWAQHRASLNETTTPFLAVWEFWKDAPFIPYNHKVDPYHHKSWPSPWEIIVENRYDDFTKALMIGWTIKLSERFKNSKIELRTLVDIPNNSVYNIILVDEKIAINYSDSGPVHTVSIPDTLSVENIIELTWPR